MRTPPRFHIGSIDPATKNTRLDDACLPWEPKDKPETRFRKLYQSVLDEVGTSTSDPSLDREFDNYLRMLWNLGLSAPVDYVENHPFNLSREDDLHFFVLSNQERGQAQTLSFPTGKKRVKTAAKFTLPRSGDIPFNVFIDDIKILRPIRFTGLPTKGVAALKKPMLFVGKCQPDLSSIPDEISGGSQLSFEAYFFWTSKVVPKENNGIIVRIANASGTLFDDSFMHYEISEQTRLRQITAEVFVLDGLDAALNIDRESFNYAHPHYQFLTAWVHRSLRQVTNKHKDLGKIARETKLKAEGAKRLVSIEAAVDDAIEGLGEFAPEAPAEVLFAEDGTDAEEIQESRKVGTLVFRHGTVFEGSTKGRKTSRKTTEQILLEERIRAVAQLLEAYGLLKEMEYEDQEKLLHAICRVFLAGGSK